jgi:hypothetical protein
MHHLIYRAGASMSYHQSLAIATSLGSRLIKIPYFVMWITILMVQCPQISIETLNIGRAKSSSPTHLQTLCNSHRHFGMPSPPPMQPSLTKDPLCEWILMSFIDLCNLYPQCSEGDGVTKALQFNDLLYNFILFLKWEYSFASFLPSHGHTICTITQWRSRHAIDITSSGKFHTLIHCSQCLRQLLIWLDAILIALFLYHSCSRRKLWIAHVL